MYGGLLNRPDLVVTAAGCCCVGAVTVAGWKCTLLLLFSFEDDDFRIFGAAAVFFTGFGNLDAVAFVDVGATALGGNVIVAGGIGWTLIVGGRFDATAGCCVDTGVLVGTKSLLLMNAGFSLSMEIFSFFPLRMTTKYFSWRSLISNGPSYGCFKAGRTVSSRMNTWVFFHNLSDTKYFDWLVVWSAVSVGRISSIMLTNVFTKSFGGVSCVASSKNSPGNRKVDPYTICAADAPMSGLSAARSPKRINGNSLTQSVDSLAMIAALSVLWYRSMIPLACG